MNIFVLDTDISKCAEYHSDKHVIKMILESTQMLCTVLNHHGFVTPYKSTHPAHPCTLWTGVSLGNWLWLRALALQLNAEYRYRFDRTRDHRSAVVARELTLPPLPDLGRTEFAQTMPDKYKIPGDPVTAYRRFYVSEKTSFAVWTKRPVPEWFLSMSRTCQ
jgi:hypothetical protein